jgi:hypothetical protein
MKCRRGVLSSVFVGLILFAGVARAGSINNLVLSVNSLSGCPSGSFCFGWDPSATAISFSLPNTGGTYQLDAVNAGTFPPSNLQITSLRLFISTTGLSLTCSSNIFANCSVTNHPNTTLVSLSGGNIPPGQYFSLDFGCASATCSWPGGTNVTARWDTNVPEPSSMALVLGGIGAIVARRRPWKTREKEQTETCTS